MKFTINAGYGHSIGDAFLPFEIKPGMFFRVVEVPSNEFEPDKIKSMAVMTTDDVNKPLIDTSGVLWGADLDSYVFEEIKTEDFFKDQNTVQVLREELPLDGTSMLLIDANRGIYSYQQLLIFFGEKLSEYDQSDFDTIFEGPDGDHYNEAFEDFCKTAVFTLEGLRYSIEEIDGNIWAILKTDE